MFHAVRFQSDFSSPSTVTPPLPMIIRERRHGSPHLLLMRSASAGVSMLAHVTVEVLCSHSCLQLSLSTTASSSEHGLPRDLMFSYNRNKEELRDADRLVPAKPVLGDRGFV